MSKIIFGDLLPGQEFYYEGTKYMKTYGVGLNTVCLSEHDKGIICRFSDPCLVEVETDHYSAELIYKELSDDRASPLRNIYTKDGELIGWYRPYNNDDLTIYKL